MHKALLISLAILVAVSLFGAGVVAERHLSEHPRVEASPSLENPADAIAAIHRCAPQTSWHVTLKATEPLILELLNCPTNVHLSVFKDSDDDGWPWPYEHQVLLLERRTRWHLEIVSALFSELNFRRVEPGKLEDSNTDAVLWSYMIKCGSCHGGPEGVLVWNNVDKRYDWNASWLRDKSQVKAIEAALPVDHYLDEAESLFWSEDRSAMFLRSAVHAPGDAHCCPEGGNVSASINIQNGKLKLSDISYQKTTQ
jgi:hypothetical protein